MSRDIYADIPVQPTLHDWSDRVVQAESVSEKAHLFGEWLRFAVEVEEIRDFDHLNQLARRELNAQHNLSPEQWRDAYRYVVSTYEVPSIEIADFTLAS